MATPRALTKEAAELACEWRRAGKKVKDIAAELNCSGSVISRLTRPKRDTGRPRPRREGLNCRYAARAGKDLVVGKDHYLYQLSDEINKACDRFLRNRGMKKHRWNY